MQNVLTDYAISTDNKYINISIVGDVAEDAPEALMVMQRFDTPRPNRHLGSSPSWGGSSALSDNNVNNKEISILEDSNLVPNNGLLIEDGKCYQQKWKYFSDLKEGEKVMSLNQETGEKEWQLPLERQEFEHEGEMFRIELEDGSEMKVSEEHKVYSKSEISNRSSYNVISLPLNSLESSSLSSFEKELISNSSLFCETLIQTRENILSLVNPKKSSSFVTNTLSSNLENSASLPLASPFGLNITSNPSDFKNISNFLLTFSSNKNLGLFGFHSNDDIVPASSYSECIVQSCLNLLSCEGGYETCKDVFDWDACFKHFQDLPNHNSSASESGLAMADFRVNDDVLVDFDSHNIEESKRIYKGYDDGFALTLVTEVYSKVSNPSEINLMILPLSCSGESCFNNSEIFVSCNSKSPASILTSQMPKCSLDENCSSVKCLSRVINNLCSDNASLNTSPFLIDLGVSLTSCPNLDRNEINPLCTFSSNKNFILCNCSESFLGGELSGEFQGGSDVVFSERRICFKDVFGSVSCLEHFQDYVNHYSCSIEGGLSVADFSVSNNISVDIFSHNAKEGDGIYKGYDNGFALTPVSEVYSSLPELFEKYAFNSSIVNTGTLDCSLKCLSLDQIGIFNSNARARNGTSFLCEISDSASPINSCLTGKNSMISESKLNINANSPNERFVILQILSASFVNSSLSSLTENNDSSFSKIKLLINGSLLNSEYTTLVSTTSFIVYLDDLMRLYTLSFNSSPSFNANSSVILLSFINSDNLLRASSFFNLLDNISLATSDQFTQENISISRLTSGSSENVVLTIYNSSSNSLNLFNFSSFSFMPLRNTSGQFTSGYLSSFFLNSSGIDNVTFSILLRPYVDKRKEVYKSFALTPVTEIYDEINNGKEVWFLDENNERVRVKGIEKVSYNGKIYDVDVENDVVLVRKNKIVCGGEVEQDENEKAERPHNNVTEKVSNSSQSVDYINASIYINVSNLELCCMIPYNQHSFS